MQPDIAAEGQGFPHEAAYPLAYGSVEALTMIRLAAAFINRPMALRWKNRRVGFPVIGRDDGAAAIVGRQGVPDPLAGGG